jgi:hypothetical protein
VGSGCTNSRTFTVTSTDGCNNTTTKTVTYTWKLDTTPPSITCPADFVATCGNITPNITGSPTAEEGCSGVTFTYTDVTAQSTCPTNYIITRTWTATDGCGNAASCQQTIWVTDTTGPVFTNCPPDVNLGCNPQNIPGCDPAVGAKADCGLTLSCASVDAQPVGCVHYRTNTYTATDGCGLSSTCVQVVTWTVDTTQPVLSGCPAPTLDLGCNPSVIPTTNTYTVTASDDCGQATVYPKQVTVTNGCVITRTITYIAVDACNNSNTCSQVVTWRRDTSPPTFTKCPASINLGCNPQTIPDCDLSPSNVAATDNCGTPTVSCAKQDQVNGCVHTRTLTYTATDACGNSRDCTQIITWRVDLPPTFTLCPSDIDLGTNPQSIPDCDTSPNNVAATDDCGFTPTITCNRADATNGCVVTRTLVYTATGGCGLTATCTQHITWTIADTQPSLTIVIQGNNIVLSWPVTCATFYLETSPNVSAPVWTRVTSPPPVVVGGFNTVTLPYSGMAFYKLCAGVTCP